MNTRELERLRKQYESIVLDMNNTDRADYNFGRLEVVTRDLLRLIDADSKPIIGQKYQHLTENRIVTVTGVGRDTVEFEWRDDKPGVAGIALSLELFREIYTKKEN